jgi:hypothetical protein
MNVSLDGVYASNPTVRDDHPTEGGHPAAKAVMKNEP